MTIGTILLILSAIGGLLAGLFGGHKIGKSSGLAEGKETGKNEAQAQQAQVQAQAQIDNIRERTNEEIANAAAPDADLDRMLQRHNRAD